jgi:hypothetical protein
MVHPASEIFKNGYANDWDKTFLYYALAKEAGLNPILFLGRHWSGDTWREKPPSITDFSALLVKFSFEEKNIFVYCGPDNCPFGVVPHWLWSGPTILLEGGSGKIGNLPVFSPEYSTYFADLLIRVDEKGNARIEENSKWNGPFAFKQRFTWKVPEKMLTQLFEKDVRSRLPNATLVSFQLSDRKNLNEPVIEQVIYDVAPLGSISSNRYIAFQLPGTGYSAPEAQESDRRFDLRLDGPRQMTRRFEIVTDPGIKLSGLPDEVTIDNDMGRFSRSVTPTDTGAIITDTTEYKAYRLPAEKYDQYLDFMTVRQKTGNQKLIFDLTPSD